MSVALLTRHKLFGLFELDAAGMVLYSRLEPEDAAPEVAGRNFYEEVLPFLNVEEFRRHVTQFTLGPSPADNFDFDCQYDGGALPVKVLLARIYEHASNSCTKSVLVHIRKREILSGGHRFSG